MDGSQILTTVLFLRFVAITLGITTSRQTTRTRPITTAPGAPSAATRTAGRGRRLHVGRLVPGHLRAIAFSGYDGFLYSVGFLVAWLTALLLVAELLRNIGKYTMADPGVPDAQHPVRAAVATSTVVVCMFYMIAQMVGAGALVALLLGVERPAGQETSSCASAR